MRSALRAAGRDGGSRRQPAAGGFFWIGTALATALFGAVVFAVPAVAGGVVRLDEQAPAGGRPCTEGSLHPSAPVLRECKPALAPAIPKHGRALPRVIDHLHGFGEPRRDLVTPGDGPSALVTW